VERGGAILVLIVFGLHRAIFGATPALPFLPFFPPIILVSVLFGSDSGVVAISSVLVVYFFIEPHFHFALPTPAYTISTVLFVLAGLSIATASETLRQCHVSAEGVRKEDRAALAHA
jgi:K+-sensing histidine kinase KdpD